LLDIDDTIIYAPNTQLADGMTIDELKKKRDQYPNYEVLISQWRLTREVKLVDEAWPPFLEQLKTIHVVYGLTQLDTGKVGLIESMEEWRYQELHKMGIIFSQEPALFYKGLLLTGNLSKSQALEGYREDILKYKQVVFVDDRVAHVQDIESYCAKIGIPCVGILFTGIRNEASQKFSFS
jgi:hypothetical protein